MFSIVANFGLDLFGCTAGGDALYQFVGDERHSLLDLLLCGWPAQDILDLLEEWKIKTGDRKEELADQIRSMFKDKTRMIPVCRGGSRGGGAVDCRVASRGGGDPGDRHPSYGFRLILVFEP